MKTTRLKSQADIELLMLIIILLLMFVIIFAFAMKRQQESNEIKDFLEQRRECLRFSSLVSSVFNSESGASVKTHTEYSAIFYNDSITIKKLQNVTIQQTKIAVLASEAGESSQDFYDTTTSRLSPIWYQICFSDIGSGAGCQQWQTEGMTVPTWNSITRTLDDLVREIDNYTVIYLEDSHIRYNAQYGGKTYLQIFQDWVNKGNILILAEHTMCREQSSGTYSATSYMCNPPGSNSDIWTIFGNNLSQRSGSYGHDLTVIIEPPQQFFPNLHKGDSYDFEENSYVQILNENYKKAYSGALTGTYSSSGGSYSDTFLDDSTYWYFGSTSSSYNITAYAEINYNISNLTIQAKDITNMNFSVRYCHDGSNSAPAACDGDAAEGITQGSQQNVEIYNYSGNKWEVIGSLRTDDNGNEVFGSFSPSGNLSNYIASNKSIRIRYELDYYNGNSQDSFLVIDSSLLNITAKNFSQTTVVGTYNADSLPAMAYWNYGAGTVYYFADFQVGDSKQNQYSGILTDLIEKVYSVFITPRTGEITCNYMGKIGSVGEFTGNVEIRNKDREVFITQL